MILAARFHRVGKTFEIVRGDQVITGIAGHSFGDTANISRDDRQVAGVSLKDDIGESFIVAAQAQRVGGLHPSRHLLRCAATFEANLR